ncbi:MAG: PHP domain-containing protein [Nitrospirales bacterium]
MRNNEYFHLILLATNQIGYHNLIKLSSKAYLEGFYYKPRMDKELLQEHQEGLIALSGCLSGEVPQLINHQDMEGALQQMISIHFLERTGIIWKCRPTD